MDTRATTAFHLFVRERKEFYRRVKPHLSKEQCYEAALEEWRQPAALQDLKASLQLKASRDAVSASSEGGQSKKRMRPFSRAALEEYVIACGGDARLLDGWTVNEQRLPGAAAPQRTFVAPSGAMFHSRAEVARSFGLTAVSRAVGQQISNRVKAQLQQKPSAPPSALPPPQNHQPSSSPTSSATYLLAAAPAAAVAAEAPPAPLSGDDVYSAEKIIARRWLPGHTRPQYRVRWVGYSEDDDTWEPEAHILNPFLLEDFQRRARLSESFQGADQGADQGASASADEVALANAGSGPVASCAACRGKHVAHTCGRGYGGGRSSNAAPAALAPAPSSSDTRTGMPLSAYNRFVQERRSALCQANSWMTSAEAYSLAKDEWRQPEAQPALKRRLHLEQEQAREEWKRRQLQHCDGLSASDGDQDGYDDDSGDGDHGNDEAGDASAGGDRDEATAPESKSSAEHAALVERLRVHMSAHGLSQTRLSTHLRLTSSGSLSSWLSTNPSQSLGTRAAIDHAVRVYLSGGPPDATAAADLALRDRFGHRKAMPPACRAVAVHAAIAVVADGSSGAQVCLQLWLEGTGVLEPLGSAEKEAAEEAGGGGMLTESHAQIKARLKRECDELGISMSRAREVCGVASAGYWSNWLLEKSLGPSDELSRSRRDEIDRKVVRFLQSIEVSKSMQRTMGSSALGETVHLEEEVEGGDGCGEAEEDAEAAAVVVRASIAVVSNSIDGAAVGAASAMETDDVSVERLATRVVLQLRLVSSGESSRQGSKRRLAADPSALGARAKRSCVSALVAGSTALVGAHGRSVGGSRSTSRADSGAGSRPEALLAMRPAGIALRQFLVRREGSTDEKATWEFEADIVDVALIRSFDAAARRAGELPSRVSTLRQASQPPGPLSPLRTNLAAGGADSRLAYSPSSPSYLARHQSGGMRVGSAFQASNLPSGEGDAESAPARDDAFIATARRFAPLCRCGLPAEWLRERWWCADASGAGCGFERAVPPCLPPRCLCGEEAAWEARARGFFCEQARCGFELRRGTVPRLPPARVAPDDLAMQIADDTAALLTASAYGPLSPFAFVSPGGSGTGLGTFARVRLQPGQAVGEFGGPRLPLRMCVRPSPQVLLLPALNLFIDGASENAPFACSSLPAVHVRRARRPNARLELWPVPRASANEVRQLVMLVAIAPVDAGAELRISDEPPQGLGFAAGLDGAAAEEARSDAWKHVRMRTPPPTAEEPIYACEDPLSVEDLAEASVHVTLPQDPPLPWEGAGGGDDRLRKLVSLLRGMSNPWPIVSTHLPGRSGRECRERWTKLVQSAVREGVEGST